MFCDVILEVICDILDCEIFGIVEVICVFGLFVGIVDVGLLCGLVGVFGSMLVVNFVGLCYVVCDGMVMLNLLVVQIIGQLLSLEI